MGVVTAKVLAYANQCKVTGLNTLQVIAAGAMHETQSESACVVLGRAAPTTIRLSLPEKMKSGTLLQEENLKIIERDELEHFANGDPIVANQRLGNQLGDLSFLSGTFWECSATWVARHGITRIENAVGDFWSLKTQLLSSQRGRREA